MSKYCMTSVVTLSPSRISNGKRNRCLTMIAKRQQIDHLFRVIGKAYTIDPQLSAIHRKFGMI